MASTDTSGLDDPIPAPVGGLSMGRAGMDHEEEFEALYEIRDPYQDLLKHGHVERWTSDPEGLRAELRRQARQDKIRVRTFRYGDHVLAVRPKQLQLWAVPEVPCPVR